jgi:hypothetical protein
VFVRDVQVRDASISGTVVNTSPDVLRDVKLMVRYKWLWDNEMHPGTDDPSRTEYFVLRQDIPPGGQVPFNYQPESPLREASEGGHFDTDVKVVSIVKQPLPTGAAEAAPAAPTAGSPRVVPSREAPLE